MNSTNFREQRCSGSIHNSFGCHRSDTRKVNCNFGPLRAIDTVCVNPPACEFQTMTFNNPTTITIPVMGTATPYPSPIIVSGMTGKIIKATVRLININHTFPEDIDIMLAGPGGQNATILSHVGRGFDLINVNLTLDDLAPTALPNNSAIVSGTFKPTNAGNVHDLFPGAPPPSGGSMLSSFNFTDPNGTWTLYVYDYVAPGGGNIAGGWELTITTSNCTP